MPLRPNLLVTVYTNTLYLFNMPKIQFIHFLLAGGRVSFTCGAHLPPSTIYFVFRVARDHTAYRVFMVIIIQGVYFIQQTPVITMMYQPDSRPDSTLLGGKNIKEQCKVAKLLGFAKLSRQKYYWKPYNYRNRETLYPFFSVNFNVLIWEYGQCSIINWNGATVL